MQNKCGLNFDFSEKIMEDCWFSKKYDNVVDLPKTNRLTHVKYVQKKNIRTKFQTNHREK